MGDTSSRWGDKDIMEHQGQGVQCGMETPEQGVEATEDSLSLVLACLGSHLDRPRRSMMSSDIITDRPSSLVPPLLPMAPSLITVVRWCNHIHNLSPYLNSHKAQFQFISEWLNRLHQSMEAL